MHTGTCYACHKSLNDPTTAAALDANGQQVHLSCWIRGRDGQGLSRPKTRTPRGGKPSRGPILPPAR
jgi:hypothetical protein